MRGRMIQGQTETAVIRLKTDDGYQSIKVFTPITVLLISAVDYTTIAKFRYPKAHGYEELKLYNKDSDDNTVPYYGVINLNKTETEQAMVGNIDVQVHLEKLADGESKVFVHKGKLARMLRAKKA